MAGHKFSGYIFSLWKALFAFLRRLFWYRSFLGKGKGNTDDPEQPEPSSSIHAQNPPPADTTHSENNPSTAAPATHPPSPADAHPAPAPAHPPVGSTSTEARHLAPDPDLENGPPSGDEEDMATSKKRGGQKRGGAGSGAKPAHATAGTQHNQQQQQQQRDKENVSPSKQPNLGLGCDPTTTTASTPAPLAPREDNAPKDHTVASASANQQRQPPDVDAVVPTPSSTPAQTPGDGQKAPAATAPPASAREVPEPAVPQLSPTTTVAPSENTSGLQKPGGDSATGVQDADLPAKSAQPADQASNMQMEQASAAVAQLNLQEQPPPAKEMDKDAAAVESAGVPSVSAVPKMLINPKPLAPLVTPPSQVLPGLIEPTTEEGKKERAEHLKFMREALEMGQLALNTNETPVGCVLVYRGRIIAKGMNATNITRNGTRHAEFMALSALLSHPEDADIVDEDALDESSWGDVAPEDGHVFPYGQKLHPSPKVSRSIISECVLYVTVEPCVMCASLLRQLCIKRVYFGAVNDKFGGTGGVFRIHQNSLRVPETTDRPYQNGYGPMDMETVAKNRAAATAIRPEQDGDGGNVEPGYPAEGGFLRDEAVSLLRRFYVQENGRAPQPRKKEGRAARLYAMENQAAGVSSSELSDGMAPADAAADTEPTSADQDKFPDDAQDNSAKA